MLNKEQQKVVVEVCWKYLEPTQHSIPVPARVIASGVNTALKVIYGKDAPKVSRKSVVRYIKRASPKAKGIRRGWTLPTLFSQQEHIGIQSKSAVSILKNQVAPSLLDAMCLVKQIVEREDISVEEQMGATAMWNNIAQSLRDRLAIGKSEMQAMLGVTNKRARLVFEEVKS